MWGNYQEVNGWVGYSWVPGFTTTARINVNVQNHIVGADGWIIGKIQAADPTSYGGKRIELFGGASLDGKLVGVPGVSLLVEGGIPVYQNLVGPQLAKAWQATAALRWKIGDQPAPTAVPDLPSRKGSPAFAASPVGSWNGLYLGLNGGYAWNGDSATNFNYTGSGGGFVALSAAGALPTGFNLSNNGFMGGGQIGYNYQINDKLVAGVESDIEGMAVGVSAANWFAASPITYAQGVRSQHTFGTVRGRAGFLVTPTLLVFGTGGLAYGEADLSAAWFSPKLKPSTQRGWDRVWLSRHAHRLDGRRRRGMDVPAEVERQGRISLLRSRHGDHDAVASGLWGEGALLERLLSGPFQWRCRPRRRELSLWLGRAGSRGRQILIEASGRFGRRPRTYDDWEAWR